MFVDTRLQDDAAPPPAGVPSPVERAGARPGLLERLRRYRPGSSVPRVLFYEAGRCVVLSVLTLIYRFRVYGAMRLPRTGPVLVVANHSSYFDPPVIGASVRRRQLDYLARAATFNFAPLAWLITMLNAISLKEGEPDTAAIKAVLRRLEEGGAVLIFPEGGRTKDGRMMRLKRGIAVLVKRAQCPVVPVAVEGAFDAWPPGQLFPSVIGKRVEVAIGRPIAHEELLAEGPEAALERIGDEIEALRMRLRRRMRRETGGTYPAWGAGDLPRR